MDLVSYSDVGTEWFYVLNALTHFTALVFTGIVSVLSPTTSFIGPFGI